MSVFGVYNLMVESVVAPYVAGKSTYRETETGLKASKQAKIRATTYATLHCTKHTFTYSRASLKQYCWDWGSVLNKRGYLNQAGSYTGPFERWDRVQNVNYGGYWIRQYCFKKVLPYLCVLLATLEFTCRNCDFVNCDTSWTSQEPWPWNCESPKVVPWRLRNHVMWSRVVECSVKSYVTGPSTECYFNEWKRRSGSKFTLPFPPMRVLEV